MRDSDQGIQRLNQEAAKAMAAAERAGLPVPPERAIRWITESTPGWLAGVDQVNGMGLAKAIAAEYARLQAESAGEPEK